METGLLFLALRGLTLRALGLQRFRRKAKRVTCVDAVSHRDNNEGTLNLPTKKVATRWWVLHCSVLAPGQWAPKAFVQSLATPPSLLWPARVREQKRGIFPENLLLFQKGIIEVTRRLVCVSIHRETLNLGRWNSPRSRVNAKFFGRGFDSRQLH